MENQNEAQFSSVTLGAKFAVFNPRPAQSSQGHQHREGEGQKRGRLGGGSGARNGGPPVGEMLVQGGHRAQSTGSRPPAQAHSWQSAWAPARPKTAPASPCPAPRYSFPSGPTACLSRESLDIENKKHMPIGQPQKPTQNKLSLIKHRYGHNESSLLGHKGSSPQMFNRLLHVANCSVGKPCRPYTFLCEQPRT